MTFFITKYPHPGNRDMRYKIHVTNVAVAMAVVSGMEILYMNMLRSDIIIMGTNIICGNVTSIINLYHKPAALDNILHN